jgi:hypothetical protein
VLLYNNLKVFFASIVIDFRKEIGKPWTYFRKSIMILAFSQKCLQKSVFFFVSFLLDKQKK